MAALRAGRLRHLVTIETATETEDSYGEADPTWATLATRRARVEPLAGTERYAAQQIEDRVDVRFTTRYLSGVKPKDRITWGSRTFDIVAVIQVEERNEVTQLLAVERVS